MDRWDDDDEGVFIGPVPYEWIKPLGNALRTASALGASPDRLMRFKADAIAFCRGWIPAAEKAGLGPKQVFPPGRELAGPVGLLNGDPVRAISQRGIRLPDYDGLPQWIDKTRSQPRRWRRRLGSALWMRDHVTLVKRGHTDAVRLDVDYLRGTFIRQRTTIPEDGLTPLSKHVVRGTFDDAPAFKRRLAASGFRPISDFVLADRPTTADRVRRAMEARQPLFMAA